MKSRVSTNHRKVKRSPRAASQRGSRRSPTSAPGSHHSGEAGSIDFYQDRVFKLERLVDQEHERLQALTEQVADLRRDRDYFLGLFQNAPVGYVAHDSRGYISAMNPAAATLLGVKALNPAATTLLGFVAKGDLTKWLEHIRRCALTHRLSTVELTLRTRHHLALPVRLYTLPTSQGLAHGPQSFHTIILDITERRATEAALRQTQQDYRRLIDTIEGIVWEADAHTLDVTFVSGYAERLLGYGTADWQRPGFWLNRIHHADRDRVANEVLRAVQQRGELRTEYRVLTAERQVVWLHDSITVTAQAGRLKLLGVAIDVTEQRQAQEQMRQVHSLLERHVEERTAELQRTVAELEGVTYSISHDLRAPLRAMMGFAELALQGGGEQIPPSSRQFIERVIAGARRADGMVQDLLSYSRVSRANFKLEPIDLEKLVVDIIGQSPQFQLPRAEVSVKRPLLPVLGHEVSLSQVLTNLLSNATKFVPRRRLPRVRVCTEPVDGQVRLWVEDNGIGIEPQHLGRIFGVFERVHSQEEFEGTGIGLAIVRKGVERMGGSVGVESKPGKGSSFWIQLKSAGQPQKSKTP